MVESPSILFNLIIPINLLFLFIGYIIGKYNSSQTIVGSQPVSFFDKHKSTSETPISKITIDETKYVTDINTSNLEKKYDDLGDIKVSDDTIGVSVNKLKNLKR